VEPPPAGGRRLLVVDPRGATPAALRRAFGLSAFEAGQWLRRPAPRLVRKLPPPEAEQVAAGWREAGLVVHALDGEAVGEAARPVAVHGGIPSADGLALRTEAGARMLRADEILIVVRGPIAREHVAATDALRRTRVASPEPGYRFSVHLHRSVHPLEIDPFAFEFEGPQGRAGGAQLALGRWLGELAGPRQDDEFRHLPPALGPSAPAAGGASRAVDALAAGRRAPPVPVLDNVLQFRAYAARRATFERVRRV
jgi:hypothetical protein